MKKYLILAIVPALIVACSGSDGSPIPWPERGAGDSGSIDSSTLDDAGSDAASEADSTSPSCIHESDAAFCANRASTCGAVLGNDNCGSTRTVLNCGSCKASEFCNGGSCSDTPCVPAKDKDICITAGKDCGNTPVTDNCGTLRVPNCGACKVDYLCSRDNLCKLCVADSDAFICQTLGKDCGVIKAVVDNCTKTRDVLCGPGVCGKTFACVDNKCVSTCQAPNHICSNVCVANDVAACGPSCTNCKPDLPGVTPACINNDCDYSTCTPGYTRCPNQPPGPGALGCQNLQNDPNNCGTCNTKCAAGKACNVGACAP